MAKKSSIVKNQKKLRLAEKYKALRSELRRQVSDVKLPDEQRHTAGIKLQKLPRNSAFIRVTRRCNITGRPRGNLRRFGLSRLMFRQLAHQGKIPGVIKSSW